ncbi:thrombospondin type 3 repeat-containing protein, partial [bacterium]|nr:thrombospondin type 3 repeat-containing protein [bacterium]
MKRHLLILILGLLALSGCGTGLSVQVPGLCLPGATENCSDGIDNDCDGDIDSADSNCPSSCAEAEICGDGVDNDCSGAVDDDESCVYTTGLVLHLDSAKALNDEPAQCTDTHFEDLAGGSDVILSSIGSSCAVNSGWGGDGSANSPYAIAFDGTDDDMGRSFDLSAVASNFTYELWVWPKQQRYDAAETTEGNLCCFFQHNLAWYPDIGGGTLGGGEAIAGVSVGTNGAGVIEHASGHFPAVMSYGKSLFGWHHVVVTFTGNNPTLYVDGEYEYASTSAYTLHPSQTKLGGGFFSHFKGQIAIARLYSETLTADQVRANYRAQKARFPRTCTDSGMDTDSDGVGDICDNCPSNANNSQTDTDDDGFGDVCDPCPGTKGVTDTDGDAVCDRYDNCPNDANPGQEDANSDGFGDACSCMGDQTTGDTDHDNICDDVDVCHGDDNSGDSDGDDYCDDIDTCPGQSDTGVDADGDGIDNACDTCLGLDDGDADGDGYCGSEDSCPITTTHAGWSTGHGADDDSDGLTNDCDLCWGASNLDCDLDGICDVDADNDGIGDPCELCSGDDNSGDSDSDGICNDIDVCEGDDAQGDTDGDTYCDDADICPLIFNPEQSLHDGDSDTIPDACDDDDGTAPDISGVNWIDNYFTSPWTLVQTGRLFVLTYTTYTIKGYITDQNIRFYDTGTMGWQKSNLGTLSGDTLTLSANFPAASYTFTLVRSVVCGVPDSDSDGFPDGCDNCPNVSNPGQEDVDSSGTGDACEYCGDGVCNLAETCSNCADCYMAPIGCGPYETADTCGGCVGTPGNCGDTICQGGFEDINTCPGDCDPDTDNDGVRNSVDNCPLIANVSQGDVDNDGVGDICDVCFGDDNSGDSDIDYICDANDNCQYIPNQNQLDSDHDNNGD